MLWQQKGGEVDHTGEWSEEVPLKGQHVRLWGLFCLLVNCFFFRILRLNFEKSKKFSPSSIPGTEHLCWVETTAGTLLYHAPAEAFLGDWGTPATPRAGLNREQQQKKAWGHLGLEGWNKKEAKTSASMKDQNKLCHSHTHQQLTLHISVSCNDIPCLCALVL